MTTSPAPRKRHTKHSVAKDSPSAPAQRYFNMARTLWQNSQKKPAKMGDCARMEALGYVVLAARVEAELTAAGGGSYEQCLQRMIEVLQQEAHRQSGGTADNGRPHQ